MVAGSESDEEALVAPKKMKTDSAKNEPKGDKARMTKKQGVCKVFFSLARLMLAFSSLHRCLSRWLQLPLRLRYCARYVGYPSLS